MTKLEQLRELMDSNGISTYIITKMDPHQSEYAHPRYNGVEYISCFSGSNGTVVVTATEAALWTDSRYFLQAKNELSTGFVLKKEGQPNAMDFMRHATNITKENGVIGFWGESLNATTVKKLNSLKKKSCSIKYDIDLLDIMWEDRPVFERENIFIYDEQYSGASYTKKVAAVREQMTQKNASVYIISSLDDIAWLFNIRCLGDFSAFNFLAYAVITAKESVLFIDQLPTDKNAIDLLQSQGVQFLPYNDIYKYIEKNEFSVAVCSKRTHYTLFSKLKGRRIVDCPFDITTVLKARKNEVEIANIKIANEKEGANFVRLIMWLKNSVHTETITEHDVVQKMEQFRKKDPMYLGYGFDPICGYGSNGAIVHYKVKEKTAHTLHPKGFLLIDIGGKYMEGVTDITRTVALGPLTEEMRKNYTTVLKANIALETLQFRHGAMGVHIDAIARSSLWKAGLHYGHGTGHGIGHLLNIHEGPQVISDKLINAVLEEDMLISNEPGVYIEGQYGIRLETSLFIKGLFENEHGKFLGFENVVFVPFEREAIVPDMLTTIEIDWLNNYHQEVYKKLSPSLDEQEKEWLKKATEKI